MFACVWLFDCVLVFVVCWFDCGAVAVVFGLALLVLFGVVVLYWGCVVLWCVAVCVLCACFVLCVGSVWFGVFVLRCCIVFGVHGWLFCVCVCVCGVGLFRVVCVMCLVLRCLCCMMWCDYSMLLSLV